MDVFFFPLFLGFIFFFFFSFCSAVRQRKVIYFVPLICFLDAPVSTKANETQLQAAKHNSINQAAFCFTQITRNSKIKMEFVGCIAKLTSMTGTKSSLLQLARIRFMDTKFTWTQDIISVISANTS